jgi:hypothetical protein
MGEKGKLIFVLPRTAAIYSIKIVELRAMPSMHMLEHLQSIYEHSMYSMISMVEVHFSPGFLSGGGFSAELFTGGEVRLLLVLISARAFKNKKKHALRNILLQRVKGTVSRKSWRDECMGH